MNARPGGFKFHASTPQSAGCIDLLGGESFNGVTFTHDEVRALTRVYGYDLEGKDVVVPEPEVQAPPQGASFWEVRKYEEGLRQAKKSKPSLESLQKMDRAGAFRNLMRNVECDGKRIMGLLARFLEPGDDPVKIVAQLMRDAGWDVSTGWEGEE